MKNVAVLLAGGVGSRVGLDLPKQLIKIAGRPILEHTLAVLDQHPDVENVWLVGGGSGHGFKHGPSVGEYVTTRILQSGATSAAASSLTPAAEQLERRFSLTTKDSAQHRAVF